MAKLINLFRRSYRAIRDTELVQIVQSELYHELTSDPFKVRKVVSLKDFVLDWDERRSKDLVLRRKCGSGEDITVSALLGSLYSEGEEEVSFSYQVLMKVCVKKPGLSSVLQFDCEIYSKDDNDDDGSDFSIYNAYYHRSMRCLGASIYKGPLFSSLDPQLQSAFKEYLIAMGIGEDLTNFILFHLHKKDRDQYVSWLRTLEAMLLKGS